MYARPFDPHWYAEQIRFVDKLRAEGHPEHLQAALATVKHALVLGRQVHSRLERPWHERLFGPLSLVAWPLWRPKRQRELRDCLTLALPNFGQLGDLLADDLERMKILFPESPEPTPAVGPIGPRSRPSWFAARLPRSSD